MRATSRTKAAKRPAEEEAAAAAPGWDALLSKSAAYKSSLLQSTQFVSTTAAAEVLGLDEPAIRRRIQDKELFALKVPGNEGYRIPEWALSLSLSQTRALLEAAAGDDWGLYLFLTTPSGPLNGLRPFELLLPAGILRPDRQWQRRELAERLSGAETSWMDVVTQTLLAEGLPRTSER